MAASDRRADRGVFEVHYLFRPAREDWSLQATAAASADEPTIRSLATFHYPASRFEREIYDLFGIEATGHPDPRPLVRHGFWPEDYFPLRKDAAPREFTTTAGRFPSPKWAAKASTRFRSGRSMRASSSPAISASASWARR